MKFSSFFLTLVSAMVLTFSSCSKVENPTVEELKAQENIHQEIISPNGVLMAKSINSLHEIIKPSVINLFKSEVEFKITHYEFLETKYQTAMLVDILTKEGMSRRIIFVKEYSNSILKQDDKCYTITCDDGECICQPTGTINNGSVSFTCNGSCSCEMTIREHECGK